MHGWTCNSCRFSLWLHGRVAKPSTATDKYNSPEESPNYFVVTDGDIRAMLKDHLSVNNTVSVTWDSAGKAVVRGSKTEGTKQ